MTDDQGPWKTCQVRLARDEKLGWRFTLDAIDEHCQAELRRISETLGPHGKRYLAKRLTTTNPDAAKLLKQLGLRREDGEL